MKKLINIMMNDLLNMIKLYYNEIIGYQKKSSLILKNYFRSKANNILDLACGKELFAEQIIKFFPISIIDGVNISKKILLQVKRKNIYNNFIFFISINNSH